MFEELFRNPLHLWLLLIVVVLLLGGNRVKDTMGSLGAGIRDFKKNIKDETATAAPATVSAAPAAAAVMTGVAANAAPAGVEVVPAIRCLGCGAYNPVESRHCNQCGNAIS